MLISDAPDQLCDALCDRFGGAQGQYYNLVWEHARTVHVLGINVIVQGVSATLTQTQCAFESCAEDNAAQLPCLDSAGNSWSKVPAFLEGQTTIPMLKLMGIRSAREFVRGCLGGRSAGAEFYDKLLDLQILMLGARRVRSRHELRALFEAVGLRLRRIVPTPLVSIVAARLS